MNTAYTFTTSWSLQSSEKDVWNVLLAIKHWPTWWKVLKITNVNDSRYSFTVGYFFYHLNFIISVKKVTPYTEIFIQTTGDLLGWGKFILHPKNKKETDVTFIWEVATTKRWMNSIAPIGKPFFIFAHKKVMQWFITGMAKELQTTAYVIHK